MPRTCTHARTHILRKNHVLNISCMCKHTARPIFNITKGAAFIPPRCINNTQRFKEPDISCTCERQQHTQKKHLSCYMPDRYSHTNHAHYIYVAKDQEKHLLHWLSYPTEKIIPSGHILFSWYSPRQSANKHTSSRMNSLVLCLIHSKAFELSDVLQWYLYSCAC